MNKQLKRIRSVQGGGIRGIIPACCDVSLEAHTGKQVRAIFDFGGSTSTGSLLNVAASAGVDAKRSLEVYMGKDSDRIFSPKDRLERDLNLVTHGRQFDAAVLHQVVQLTIGDPAYNWTMNDCPWPMLITAGDQRGKALYFTQDRTTNSGKFGKYSMLNAAVASACATTYHDPWKIEGVGWCVDGGCVSLADPVYQTCVEAFAGYKCYGAIDPTDAIVINFGTGWYDPEQEPDPPGPLLDRVTWVTSSLVGSSKTIAAETVDRHYPGVQTMLNPQLSADVDEAALQYKDDLYKIGTAFAASIDWDTLLQL